MGDYEHLGSVCWKPWQTSVSNSNWELPQHTSSVSLLHQLGTALS